MTNQIAAFMPHGYCISWDPFLLWLHLSSDALIALAYFSIPFGILYLVNRKKDLSFKPVYYLFAGFILACGITHVLGMVTLWIPMYYVQGWAKLGTALISMATAIYLLPKLPKILALPDLQQTLLLNQSLQEEAESRKAVEEKLALSEEQLRQSNQLLNQVLNSIPQRVYWKNEKLQFLGANGSFLSDFNLKSADELKGQRSANIHGHSLYEIDSALEEAAITETNSVVNREVCLAADTTPPTWVRVSLVPLHDEHQQPVGLMGTYQDISKSKEAETKLQNANDIANAALRAQAAFLANISHEVRTPISGVIGSLNLLAESPLDPHQSELVLGAKLSSESMLELLNDILDLSKIESNQFEFSLGDVQLEHLLHQVAKSFEVIAENKNISLVCPANAVAQDVYLADRTRMRQILSNLVSNAIKFTQAGYVQVTVECLSDSSFESELKFTVKDSGIGIPQDQQDRIFDRFAQVDDSHARRQSGTGLGLSIVKELVERMGGHLGVTSELGKGSQFWFSVKLQKAKKQPQSNGYPEKPKCRKIYFWMGDHILQERLCCLLIQWGLTIDQLDELDINEAMRFSELYLKDSIIVADKRLQAMPIGAQKMLLASEQQSVCKLLLIASNADKHNPKWLRKEWKGSVMTRPIAQDAFYRVLSEFREGKARINVATTPTQTPLKKQFKGKILIAEDVPLNQKILGQALGKHGLEVTYADDGAQALEILRNQKFDLLFMDCQMPLVDGFEATNRIRHGEVGRENQSIPIIALTAHSMVGDEQACIDAGMSFYMSKPVDLFKLGDVLEQWLPASSAKKSSS